MNWQNCKNILCIRPDNMGDLMMTVPAIRALKETFNAKITVLTSPMASGIVKHIPEIDDAIIIELPWVKSNNKVNPNIFNEVISVIKAGNFDAAVIFTVYSQNPLPTVMLGYLAGIPKILAYCRENPYQLISDWVPDTEPYETIKHQVKRDLDLVAKVGAFTNNECLSLQTNDETWICVSSMLKQTGVDIDKPWLIVHPGVSEAKRSYPQAKWVEAAKRLIDDKGYQVLLTGTIEEKKLTDNLAMQIGRLSYSVAGLFSLEEFISLVRQAPVVISVNTATIHIAAATGTPVVVLYAQTNPQHTPWRVQHIILPFEVPVEQQSRNEVIKYVANKLYNNPVPLPDANDIFDAVTILLNDTSIAVHLPVATPLDRPAIPAS